MCASDMKDKEPRDPLNQGGKRTISIPPMCRAWGAVTHRAASWKATWRCCVLVNDCQKISSVHLLTLVNSLCYEHPKAENSPGAPHVRSA